MNKSSLKQILKLIAVCVVGLLIVACGKAEAKLETTNNSEAYPSVAVGDIITFGNYQWQVLDISGDAMLIISKTLITERRFDEKNNVWQSSEIRKWLNGEFYNTFNEIDKNKIKEAEVLTGDISTTELIFLLSYEEANELLSKSDRTALSENDSVAWWWLRSPTSNTTDRVYFVRRSDGDIDDYMYSIDRKGGIRPAMWYKSGNSPNEKRQNETIQTTNTGLAPIYVDVKFPVEIVKVAVYYSEVDNEDFSGYQIDKLQFTYNGKVHSVDMNLWSEFFQPEREIIDFITTEDVNFDGHADIVILTAQGVSNRNHAYFIYNPFAHTYIKNEEMSYMLNLSFDHEKQEVYDYNVSGAGLYFTSNTYKWIDGKLKMIYSMSQSPSSNDEKISIRTTRKLVEENWVEEATTIVSETCWVFRQGTIESDGGSFEYYLMQRRFENVNIDCIVAETNLISFLLDDGEEYTVKTNMSDILAFLYKKGQKPMPYQGSEINDLTDYASYLGIDRFLLYPIENAD